MFGRKKKAPELVAAEPTPALQARCGFVDAEGKFYATADEALAALRLKAVERLVSEIEAEVRRERSGFSSGWYAEYAALKKSVLDWDSFSKRVEQARAITIPMVTPPGG